MDILDAPKITLMTGQFWDISSQGFVVDGRVINFSKSGLVRMILDSGVYGGVSKYVVRISGPRAEFVPVLAPPEYVEAIYGSVPGAFLLDDGTWNVPCDTRFNLTILLGYVCQLLHPINTLTPCSPTVWTQSARQKFPFIR